VNSDWFAYDMAVMAEEFFKKELKVTKVALLLESSVWAREMSTVLEKELPKRGLKIVYLDVFDPKRTDFSPQFSQIRSKGAELLLTVQALSPGVPITNQWADTQLAVHQAGFSLNSQVSDFWDKTGGKCQYENTQLINGARAPITAKSIPFYDKYVQTYKLSPPVMAWGQYDALYFLKAAAEQAKSLDTEVLIKTMEKMRYEGAAGIIAFTKDHDLKYGKANSLFGPSGRTANIWCTSPNSMLPGNMFLHLGSRRNKIRGMREIGQVEGFPSSWPRGRMKKVA
jgi:branched-chain amino acid transport system substrate-binding protein